jgi:hypothetical protein
MTLPVAEFAGIRTSRPPVAEFAGIRTRMLDHLCNGHHRRHRWLLPTLLLALASGCGTAPDQIRTPAAAAPLAQPAETNTDPAVAGPLDAPFEPSRALATDSDADPDVKPSADTLPPPADGQAVDAPPAANGSEHDNFDLFEVVIDRYRRMPE